MFLTNIMIVFMADIRTTVISLIIGFVAYKLSKFYLKVYSLPPGPLPLPIIGNLLHFLGTKQHWSSELEKIADKSEPVFTMWLGICPVVFITDIDIARDVFNKNEFNGRPECVFGTLVNQGESMDIVTANYGHHWEALRRVTISAVKKHSSTKKLVHLVCDIVDHTMKNMVEKEGLNKPFDPSDYIYNMFLNILASTAFGQRYELDDPEYEAIKYIQKDFIEEIGQRFFFWEMFPILRKIDFIVFPQMKRKFNEKIILFKNKFQNHCKDFDESVIRDFCDSLISAKSDALREGKESAPYLTDDNLILALFDLVFAGTDTSQTTFRWLVFLMLYYPEIHKKLRQEIEDKIGDRLPTHEDRDCCHYVMAFISETLRHRNIVPPGVPHKAVVTSKIGQYTIPKGTIVCVFQSHILRNEKYWDNPKQFRPERFLKNGQYIKTRPKAFIPFGVGRRVCLGEKFALVHLFVVLVRFIQRTADYNLKLHCSSDSKANPNGYVDFHPKDHKISLCKI